MASSSQPAWNFALSRCVAAVRVQELGCVVDLAGGIGRPCAEGERVEIREVLFQNERRLVAGLVELSCEEIDLTQLESNLYVVRLEFLAFGG